MHLTGFQVPVPRALGQRFQVQASTFMRSPEEVAGGGDRPLRQTLTQFGANFGSKSQVPGQNCPQICFGLRAASGCRSGTIHADDVTGDLAFTSVEWHLATDFWVAVTAVTGSGSTKSRGSKKPNREQQRCTRAARAAQNWPALHRLSQWPCCSSQQAPRGSTR